MLGFSPLSSVPLNSLPAIGSNFSAYGFTSGNLGTPHAAWTQFGSASGFSGSFGTPTNARTQPATGFTSGSFGTPFGKNVQVVSGFTSGAFGSPRIYPFNVAPGIHSGQFGTPSGRQYWQAHALVMPGRFGTPYVTFNQTREATGFTSGLFGTPLGMRILPPNVSRICIAQPVMPGHFGTPRHTPTQTGSASSIGPGLFGAPNSRMTQPASGFCSAGFGSPTAAMLARSHGFCPGIFGTPTARRTQLASSVYRAPRWGTAKAVRSNTYEAVSIYVGTRMGQPTGRIVRRASGFTGGAFGTPYSSQIHLASSIPPSGRFGKPLLRRTTQC